MGMNEFYPRNGFCPMDCKWLLLNKEKRVHRSFVVKCMGVTPFQELKLFSIFLRAPVRLDICPLAQP
jgi:hypothetical protein